jgi:hypothetical protein
MIPSMPFRQRFLSRLVIDERADLDAAIRASEPHRDRLVVEKVEGVACVEDAYEVQPSVWRDKGQQITTTPLHAINMPECHVTQQTFFYKSPAPSTSVRTWQHVRRKRISSGI